MTAIHYPYKREAIMKPMKQQRMETAFGHEQGRIVSPRPQATASLRWFGIYGIMRSAGKSFAAGAFLYTVMASVPAFADTIYSQPPLLSPFNSTRDSHVDTNVSDGSTWFYDDFIATQSGSISNITWHGGAQTNAAGGFTIQIFPAKTDPATGVLLDPATPDTPASNLAALLTLTVPGSAGQTANPNVSGMYDFHADLQNPFNLMANDHYWITIYSNGLNPWGWGNGSGGNTFAEYYSVGLYNQFLPLNQAYQTPDRAFSLNGTAIPSVPLPGAVWLFGSGLMGLLPFSRRKNKTANAVIGSIRGSCR